MEKKWVAHRALLLAFAGISLLIGLGAGLSLLGLVVPRLFEAKAIEHGPLMVFGFVAGAIVMERTVATKVLWAWAAPVCHVVGVVSLIAGAPRVVTAVAFCLSFMTLGVSYVLIYRRQPTLEVVIQASGTIGIVCAVVQWAVAGDFAPAMPLAAVFVIATIIGERVELARLKISQSNADVLLTALVLALVAASLAYMAVDDFGLALIGAIFLVIAGVAGRVDVAINLIRSKGLPRFSAACMLAAYGWLAVAGILWLTSEFLPGDLVYDAAVHAVFIGFTLSMIFAHAPVILPAVLHRALPYHSALYVPVVAVHLGLILRIVSDTQNFVPGHQIGGVVNVVGVLGFLITAVILAVRAGMKKRKNLKDRGRQHADSRP